MSQKDGGCAKWSMCAECVCSVAGDSVLVMAMVGFDVKNASGHDS